MYRDVAEAREHLLNARFERAARRAPGLDRELAEARRRVAELEAQLTESQRRCEDLEAELVRLRWWGSWWSGGGA